MLVKRGVIVKVAVTDAYREQLLGQLREALDKVESAIRQLEVEGSGYLSELASRDPSQAETFRRKLDDQKQRQESVRAGLAERIADAEVLSPGDEYLQGRLEGFVEIGVGDNLSERLREPEILVRDGLVVEIRNT